VSGREGVGGEERSRGGREMGSVRCGVLGGGEAVLREEGWW
jgi:hypothetical protein